MHLTTLFTVILFIHQAFCWFEWTNSDGQSIKYDPQIDFQNSKFEIPTVNENLLILSESFMNVSPIQACKFKIVTKLKAACSKLNDEEMSRMTIAMLNCQLELEGLKQFECDSTMSLSQCIKQMNETTWNTYEQMLITMKLTCQILNQQIFQHQIENTINKISIASENYLVSLGKFKVEHEGLAEQSNQIKESTEKINENVNKFTNTIKEDYKNLNDLIRRLNDMLKTQNRLMESTQKLNTEIFRELDLKFESINRKVETLETILTRINNQSVKNLDNNLAELNINFAHIQSSLIERFEKNISSILSLMEQSSMNILKNQEYANQRYQESLAHLDMLNSSVHYLKIAIHGYILKIDSSFVKVKKFASEYGDYLFYGGIFCLFSLVTFICSKFCLVSMKNLMVIQSFSLTIIVSINYLCEKLELSYLDLQELVPFALISQIILLFFLRSYSKIQVKVQKTSAPSISKTPIRSPIKEASNSYANLTSSRQLQYQNGSSRMRVYGDYEQRGY